MRGGEFMIFGRVWFVGKGWEIIKGKIIILTIYSLRCLMV